MDGVCWQVWREFSRAHASQVIRPLVRGHIHESYEVASGHVPLAVLQKISRRVFPRPEALIANAGIIEPFLGDRVATRIFTRDGRPYCVDADGEYWRAYEYVDPSQNLERPETTSQCFAAGEAFGGFQAALEKLPADQLETCIEGFQDAETVRAHFDLAVKEDPRGRLAESRTFYSELMAERGQAPSLSGPFGVVHGDCKFNNLLFDAGGERVVAILDLDTVMRHRRALDFGDLVRAGAVRGPEDDIHAEFDVERASAFAAGFRAGAGALAPDGDAMTDALLHVTFMLSMRFFADHLKGDVYFAVESSHDNLRRAKGQFALYEQLRRRRAEIEQAFK